MHSCGSRRANETPSEPFHARVDELPLSAQPAAPDDSKKPAGKTISLIDAIQIAEKTGKGMAVKAERNGEGEGLVFKVDLVGKDGSKSKIEMNAAGQVQMKAAP